MSKDCFAFGSLVTVKELLRLRLAGDEKTNFYRNINVRLILLRHLQEKIFFQNFYRNKNIF